MAASTAFADDQPANDRQVLLNAVHQVLGAIHARYQQPAPAVAELQGRHAVALPACN